MIMNDYKKYMKKCITLALKGEGQTSPNPLVGCVVLDKNGKEIYEGDVVKKFGTSKIDEALGRVDYDSEGMRFYIELIRGYQWAFYYPDGCAFSPDELEVIGNIYENPELVEK